MPLDDDDDHNLSSSVHHSLNTPKQQRKLSKRFFHFLLLLSHFFENHVVLKLAKNPAFRNFIIKISHTWKHNTAGVHARLLSFLL